MVHKINKRQRISKGQSKMDNPEKLTTQGTQDEEKTNQIHKAICVGHHYIYAQTNTNNDKRHEYSNKHPKVKTNKTLFQTEIVY